MPTNLTGAQGDQTLDCTVNQYNISGNCTQNAGTTTEFVTGAGTPQAITWGGSFTFVTTGTGQIKVTGTAAKRLRFQPSGAATTWDWGAAANSFIQNTSTGALTLIYTDFFWSTTVNDPTGGTNSVTFCRVFNGRPTGAGLDGFFFRPSGGTNTFTDCEAYNCGNGAYNFAVTGGTNTVARHYAAGSGTGFILTISAATTVSDLKAVRCTTGFTFGGTAAITASNLAALHCAASSGGTPGATCTITRFFSDDASTANTGIVLNPGAIVVTLEEPYVATARTNGIYNASATYTRVVVQNGVVVRPRGEVASVHDGITGCQCSGNDVSWYHILGRYCIQAGSSDNDYLEASDGMFVGEVPPSADGFLSDWASANLVRTYDPDSGNTTSTNSTGRGYSGLSINRTNPRATPNKPLTVTSIVATPGSNTVNFTWTTGIRARSRLLIGTAAGVTRANATIVSPWKYHGILDPELVDFTLPVTSHNHDVPLPPGTYYAVPENYDACGRRFLGAETQFTIAAAGGGAARSGFAGAGMRVA